MHIITEYSNFSNVIYYSIIVNRVAAFIGFSLSLLKLHPIQLLAKYNACVGLQSGADTGLGVSPG